MAFNVTKRAKTLFEQTEIRPNIVLKIDGYGKLFGAEIIRTDAKFGENNIKFGDPGLVFGGLAAILDQYDLISLSGTSNEINQQLEPDQGNVSSVQKMTIRLVDQAEEITRLVSPSFVFDDILYRYAQVYIGHTDSAFPDDYIELFNGNIQGVRYGAGFIDLEIVNPEDFQKAELFTKAESALAQPINFNSRNIQGILFQAYNHVVGTVQVNIVSGASGDNAIVSVSGNNITIQIDVAATKIKTVKQAVEDNSSSRQLVQVSYLNGTNKEALATTTGGFLPLIKDTTIYLDDVRLFLDPVGSLFKTYILVGEELIEYTGRNVTNNTLTGCVRESLNTVGKYHTAGETVTSFYKLGDGTQANGNAIDLALKVLLSGQKNPSYFTNLPVVAFAKYGTFDTNPNAVYFKNADLERELGIVAGDFVTITGAANAANNIVDIPVKTVVKGNGFSALVFNHTFVQELGGAVASAKSQYNVLPDGLGLLPRQVDILRFLEIKKTYYSDISLNEIYLKDTVRASELLNKHLYLPSALFSLPRRGRVSIGFLAPPLFDPLIKTLNLDTVKNVDGITVSRSTTRNFYNAIIYRYNEDSLEDKFLNGRIEISSDSINRIKMPNRPYTIEAKGLRNNTNTTLLIERLSERFLERYQYGAESLEVDVPFSVGWSVEIGDPIIFGDEAIQLTDTNKGKRSFSQRIFEVTNKRLNWKTGQIRLSLLDTSFNLSVRRGVFSPASKVVSGTTTSIIIKDSFGTEPPNIEQDKWQFYIGKQILVHNEDWSVQAVTRLLGFSENNAYEMLVQTLPFTPQAGYFVRLPNYSSISENQSQIYKQIHPFWCPVATVASVVNSNTISVSATDITKFFVGSLIRVHNSDYSFDTGRKGLKVKAINTLQLVLEGSTTGMAAGHNIELIGFASDNGQPYTWL